MVEGVQQGPVLVGTFFTTVRGLACPPAPPSDHWYGGLGGSLADSEA